MSAEGGRLQLWIDAEAVTFMDERGKLPIAVHLHPLTPAAGELLGYTVVLDPDVPIGTARLK